MTRYHNVQLPSPNLPDGRMATYAAFAIVFTALGAVVVGIYLLVVGLWSSSTGDFKWVWISASVAVWLFATPTGALIASLNGKHRLALAIATPAVVLHCCVLVLVLRLFTGFHVPIWRFAP